MSDKEVKLEIVLALLSKAYDGCKEPLTTECLFMAMEILSKIK